MSEYVPTADEVREMFAIDMQTRRLNPDYAAGFDRWLAAHDAEVAAKARREGHVEGYQTARSDLVSGAFIGGPTYDALRDSFSGRKIADEAVAAERERVGLILDAVQSSLDSNSSYCDCSGYQRVEWLEDQFAAIRGGESE